MPSFNAHYLFAHEKLDFAKKAFPEIKEFNEGAYNYGAQGPDLMYFARLLPTMPGPDLMPVGDEIHEGNPTMMIQAMKNYFKENPNDYIAQSFIVGFLAHYTLDRNCHPFVYSREQMIWEDGHQKWDRTWIHNIIEHNFDTYAINRFKGLDKANKFVSYKVIPKDEDIFWAINRVFSYITPRMTNIDIDALSPKSGYFGAKDSHTIMFLLQDSTGLKRSVLGNGINLVAKKKVGPVGTCFFVPKVPLTDYDYFNMDHHEWTEPRNPEFKSTDSLADLFDKAFVDYEQILTKFAAYLKDDSIDPYTITEDHGFDTSLQMPRCENPVIKM